jgi:hypothetical protein
MHVTLDLATNSLHLALDTPLTPSGTRQATLDLATRGRLLGLEIGDRFIVLGDAAAIDQSLTRSVEVMVEVASDGRTVILPRSGPGWEIAFPSGNRCWIPRAGEAGKLSCEVVIPAGPRD